MSADLRNSIAVQQAALVRALSGLEPCPVGFDVNQFNMASNALLMKRSRAAAKAWPDLAAALDDQFERMFTAYACEHPNPPPAGPVVDGYRFGEFLAANDQLTEAVLRTWLRMRLRYRCTETGIEGRRGLAVVWDRRPGTFRIRIRLGWSSLIR